jgi:hypothetical protein
MKINQILLTISTFLVTLPMQAQAMDKNPEKYGIPSNLKTGFVAPTNRIKTESETRRDFSRVIEEMNAIPKEELNRRVEHYHISAICEELEAAERYVPFEVRQFIPPELLAEIGFSNVNGESLLDIGQKQFRLGLKIIDYTNLLYGYILTKINDNREFIVAHKDSNHQAIRDMVSRLKFSDTDMAPIPQGVQELMINFIHSPNPTPELLDRILKHHKNKYVALQFLLSSNNIYKAAEAFPDENVSDILFSVALGYKWVGDRLDANYRMSSSSSITGQEPYHYQYYRKALEVHSEARSKLRYANAEFKKKYLLAMFKDFWNHPQTSDSTFIANPSKVIPSTITVGAHS